MPRSDIRIRTNVTYFLTFMSNPSPNYGIWKIGSHRVPVGDIHLVSALVFSSSPFINIGNDYFKVELNFTMFKRFHEKTSVVFEVMNQIGSSSYEAKMYVDTTEDWIGFLILVIILVTIPIIICIPKLREEEK